MIRHSIHTGLGRGRPELTRLSEGIASSLRQFSIAQARCAAESNDAAGTGAPSRPSSNRQRSAAAAKELLSSNGDSSAPKRPSNSMNDRSTSPKSASGQASASSVISVNTLRGGIQGRFAGFRKVTADGSNYTGTRSPDGPPPAREGVISGNVIRGGFRGRGRGGSSFAGRGGGQGAGRQARDGNSSGGFRPRRGRGGKRRGDDRPVQGRKGLSKQERLEEEAYQRFKSSGADEDPALTTYNEAQEAGAAVQFQPTLPNDLFAELAGYAPAVATSAAPLAQTSTIITQARMLGGGRNFHPQDWPTPSEAKELYQKGHGVFFPSAESKAWAAKQTRKVAYQNPPTETTTAVADAALLGKYNGPKFAQPRDTIGTVSSYMKRHGTWTAAAERDIEAKVKSLLPAAKAAAKAPTNARVK